ncbi:hypothetical protein C2G38_2244584 [Gigaspora rosea]|uniref:F-box domain-containing protein n=1 Tax=Gigaspora rosea TaxID=44941 RepID=A0A397VHF9_9GLOM|nr:hypothetical protein C2G38_2244584 [Gigaspora rosea]
MPELMDNIVKNLNNETYSLYSCALVSRHWCKISIPILWQDPFSFSRRSPLFISNYFSSLSEYEKIILKECGINEEFSKTIFDYARFLKALNLSRLYFQVEKWIKLVLVNSNSRNDNRLKHKIIIDITNLLLKLLIENGATLHSLDLCFSRCREFKPEIFYVLGQNEQFLSQLQYLSLSAITFYIDIDSATTWLKAVAKYTIKISTLDIEVYYLNYSQHIFRALINVIKSQEQLRQFGITGVGYFTEFYGMISTLESQKNSLQEFIIDSCAFNEEFECCNDDDIPDEELKKRVMQFSEILPLTLQYLNFKLLLGPYIDILLNHCNVPLKKLLIYKIYDKKIAKALIEFCIRNKTLNYVGVYEYLYLDDNIRKEVEAYVELVPFERIRVCC